MTKEYKKGSHDDKENVCGFALKKNKTGMKVEVIFFFRDGMQRGKTSEYR